MTAIYYYYSYINLDTIFYISISAFFKAIAIIISYYYYFCTNLDIILYTLALTIFKAKILCIVYKLLLIKQNFKAQT